ncbi:MAG: hypothetical protein FJW23_15665 [Acidimicrobiia bacterium]|nr:hypothetical protein [Acidimicrobiia bacterium]
MKRLILRACLPALFVLAGAGAAPAQQILNVGVGGFTPRGEDARVPSDVLTANRTFLAFNLADFNGATFNGEWLAAVGPFFEVGGGLGFYRRTVPSVYDRFVNADGSEIAQRMRLRIVPAAATVRLLPFGTDTPVQPYFGAGAALFNWRYSESGEFIDFSTSRRDIFQETYQASGNSIGPVVVAGLRFNAGNWVTGGEVRYSSAEATVGSEFAAGQLDLGGWAYQFTMGVRFR